MNLLKLSKLVPKYVILQKVTSNLILFEKNTSTLFETFIRKFTMH